MNDWLQLVAWIVAALIAWLGVARVLAATEEPPVSGERRRGARAPAQRDAPTGTGPAQGPRLYSDVDRSEQRDYGDEDPPRYGKCLKCGGRLFVARDGARCADCGKLTGPTLEQRTMRVDPPYGLPAKHKPIFDKCHGIARPPREKVKRKRDGIRLGDEASAELLKGIFGDHPPA